MKNIIHLMIVFVSFFTLASFFLIMSHTINASPPDSNTLIEIRLYLNDTSSNIHVPLKNPYEEQASGISYSSFSAGDLKHPYIASYSADSVTGLVFYASNLISSWINKSGNEYVIAMKLNLTDSQVFIPFARGDWRTVESKMRYVESKTFMNAEKPSFSHGIGKNQIIMMYIAYDNIDLTSNITSIGKGYHRLVVENKGVMNDKTWLHIRRI